MNQIITPKQINFNELVKHSETTLSLNIQTKMIDLLTEEFTEEEQKWYVANLYVYMNYHPTNDYPINLEHVFKMIGFANKGNAMKTLKSNFIKDEDYKKLLFRTEKQVKDGKDLGGAGLNHETVMLNVDTFKNLCMMARTEKGKEIRKYYVKLENIYNKIIKEELEEQKLIQEETQKQLEENKKQLEEKDENFIIQSKLNKHKFLLEKFSYRKCIYLMSIDDSKIKIGSTNDINLRKNNLKDVFGTCIFLDVFECKYYREVEQNILVAVRNHIYKEKINNHISKEIVELSNNFNYAQLIRIINEEIKKYNKHMDDMEISKLECEHEIEKTKFEIETKIIEKEKQRMDFELKKLEIEHKKLEIYKVLFENKTMDDIKYLLKETQLYEIIPKNEQQETQQQVTEQQLTEQQQENEQQIEIMPISGSRGRKIQEIDPDNLNVIKKLYTSMINVLRENIGYDKQAIQKAIKNNKIYKGSRWLFVEHNQDPNIVNNIQETVKSNQLENNYICRVNKEKKEILEIFTGITQMRTKYKIGDTRINYLLNNNVIYDNSYFIKITECPNELLKKFKMPDSKSKKAKSIKQTNINTKEEIIYKSITDMYIKTGITYKKMAKIIENQEIIQESKWEYIN